MLYYKRGENHKDEEENEKIDKRYFIR